MRRTHLYKLGLAAVAIALAVSLPLGAASEKIDYDGLAKIRDQGMRPETSKVMEISSWLNDVYGPRLTGSPNIQKAGEWAVAEMKKWGLTNVSMEPWPSRNGFERGWQNEKFYFAAVSPQAFPIPGTPSGWTPGTNGLVRGDAVLVTETTQEDLQKYAGKLRGKWILTQPAPDVAAYWNPLATRRSREDLDRMDVAAPGAEFGVTPPGGARGGRQGAPAAAPGQPGQPGPGQRAGGPGGGRGGAGGFNRNEFFRSEGALGLLSTAPRGHGIYTIGGQRTGGPDNSVTQVVIPAEQYGRIARMLEKNLPVTLEADIKNTYTPNPPMFNVVGEIRGTDKADELVMLGAHFDSWHASTGATDNGAGSAAMMEAMRILKQSGVTLRRTVRIGLWTGEEQGLLGSCEYVSATFGKPAPPPPPPAGGRGGGGGCESRRAGGPTMTPAAAKFAGYFNIDNGTGAIRGVYLQSNPAVAPIFREWMEPLKSLGMGWLTIGNTGGTDHLSYDAIGLPGFQFIQDAVEYDTMTHHTNLDSYERLQPGDMMRNATIAATFAYLTANRDEKLPRKPAAIPAGGRRGTGAGQ